jgi:hypothetical protein
MMAGRSGDDDDDDIDAAAAAARVPTGVATPSTSIDRSIESDVFFRKIRWGAVFRRASARRRAFCFNGGDGHADGWRRRRGE